MSPELSIANAKKVSEINRIVPKRDSKGPLYASPQSKQEKLGDGEEAAAEPVKIVVGKQADAAQSNGAIRSPSTAKALTPEAQSTLSAAVASNKQDKQALAASAADADELVIIDDQETDAAAITKDAAGRQAPGTVAGSKDQIASQLGKAAEVSAQRQHQVSDSIDRRDPKANNSQNKAPVNPASGVALAEKLNSIGQREHA